MKNITYKFYLRKLGNKHYLYLRLILKRKKSEKSLKCYIPYPEHFKGDYVKGTYPEAVKANVMISYWKNRISNIILDHTLKRKETSIHDILHDEFDCKAYFFDFYCKIFQEKQQLLKRGGWKKYLTEYNKLKEFNPNLNWSDFDQDFGKKYYMWLINEKKNNINTANRALRLIKTVLNEAVRQGYLEENPMKDVKTKWVKGQLTFLTKNELMQLHTHIFEKETEPKLKIVGSYFLFSCYTGLRYSDVKKLKWSDISENYIKIIQEKTNNEVLVPLNNKAKKILENQNKDTSLVFKCYSNAKTNQYLKIIAEKSGINKRLTFHTARHTFATVSIELGIPIEVISKILGHSDIKITQVYARILDPIKFREMEKWNF